MNISASERLPAWTLVPFAYYAATRLKSARDLAYLVFSSFVPAIWIILRETDLTAANVLTGFALGYLAFIAIYEIGYLANDHWDAARDPEGRQRGGGASLLFVAVFVLVRLALWLAIAWSYGWLANPIWLAGYAALAAVLVLHNILRLPALRLATFTQLAALRFALPVVALLDSSGQLALLLSAVLIYVPLRWLAYADSKGLLAMKDRKNSGFGALYLALGLPLCALASLILRSTTILEVALLLALSHAAWALLSRYASGAKR